MSNPTTDELAVAFVTAAEQIDNWVDSVVELRPEGDESARELSDAWQVLRDHADAASSGGTVRP